MSELINKRNKTLCNDCIFHVSRIGTIECTHPEEFEINCYNITFCNSFQPMHEVESPCVAYGQDVETF